VPGTISSRRFAPAVADALGELAVKELKRQRSGTASARYLVKIARTAVSGELG
jgi:hypothetical protein